MLNSENQVFTGHLTKRLLTPDKRLHFCIKWLSDLKLTEILPRALGGEVLNIMKGG